MLHRTIAIVAADIVGYGRMLERDEEGTLAAIAMLQKRGIAPLLGEGRVFRLLGDGSLFEFPTAQEAVRFAIALQEHMRAPETALTAAREPLRLRMGVHCGDVVDEGGDLHGESVTIAARLEAMAPEGGLVISDDVHDRIKSGTPMPFVPLGPRHLKNVAVQVAVWRWLEPERTPGPDRTRSQPTASNGRQILDPRATDLLLELHMRSARLAVSDAIDDILTDADEGRGLTIDSLYQRIGDRLNPARDLLSTINVQCIGDASSYIGEQEQLVLGRYISRVFDNARTAFAFRLLPQIAAALKSTQPVVQRRRAIMALIEAFMSDEMLPRLRALIEFAFIDA